VIAIQEAKKLGIPIVGIIDSNSNPDGITYPVPGNDDAARAINLYCDLLSKSVIEGISQSQGDAGIDLGEAVEPLAEELPVEEVAAEAPATEAPATEA
jgi:small subunit ribosomal protein S2